MTPTRDPHLPPEIFQGGRILKSPIFARERRSTNDGRFQTALKLSERSAYARYYYFRSPVMPTLDSDHAECEGVWNGLRSLGFALRNALQLTNMYFGNFLKNYWPYCHKIFTIPREHRVHQHVKILGKSDEAIFRGRVGKKFFDPYISLMGVARPPNFYTP